MAKNFHYDLPALLRRISGLLITILFCILISLSFDSVNVHAKNVKASTLKDLSSEIVVNPLYSESIRIDTLRGELEEIHQENSFSSLSEGVINQDDPLSFDFENIRLEAAETFKTATQCGTYLRECMRKRVSDVSFTIESSGDVTDAAKICSNLKKSISAVAFAHTGDGSEGDYLYWSLAGYQSNVKVATSGSSITAFTMSYVFKYYTTEEQETALTNKINSILSNMKLNGKSDYYKVETIYCYICDNVDYDYSSSDDVMKYTAYAALFDKKAVCQGYSALFYRMALQAGVDTRIIPGIAYPGKSNECGHAWNIVKLGSKYYSLDSTWDANSYRNEAYYFSYFLRCESKFSNHKRANTGDIDVTSDAFLKKYPLAASDYHYHSGYSIVVDKTTPGKRVTHCSVCKCILCGNPSNTIPTVASSAKVLIPVIKLNALSAKLKVGQTTTAIKVSFSKGDAILSWSSSDPSIATVSSTGKIKAKKTGICIITVKLISGKTASIVLTVQKKAVATTRLTITSGKTVTLKKGKTFKIKYSRAPLTCAEKVKFSSSKSAIASVTGKGVIRAKKKGKTTIKVKSGTKTQKIKVVVK